MSKLIQEGSTSVSSWYKRVSTCMNLHNAIYIESYELMEIHVTCNMSQVDIQQQDLLLFVINDCGNHWTLLV